jgi:hypothetical protein
MTFKTADRVYETSITTGAGDYTLAGAQVGFQAFNTVGANNTCPYFATDDTNWEVGIGTYISGPDRLQRTKILASSNAGAAVNWGVGTRKLRIAPVAAFGAPRVLTKSVAGSSNVTLTEDEQRNDIVIFTGALTGSIAVEVDATPWQRVVFNNTTGAFKLTLRVTGQTGVEITQGTRERVHCDGTDVVRSDDLQYRDLGQHVGMVNGTIVTSRAGNAETVAIKTLAGNDPSAADPVLVLFRNATVGTGDFAVLRVTAATSIVISSGSTLGFSNGVPGRFWLVGFNDAGTFRLGVINCLSGTNIYPLGQDSIASSTAEGGAGAADSAQVFYTGTAVTSKAYAILGFLEYTLATAGTWNTAPSRVRLYGNGVPLPGQEIQRQRTASGAVATGSTILPWDDTIPQSTEGDQYLSQAITPTSAANVLAIEHSGTWSIATATDFLISALFQDAVANALAAVAQRTPATDVPVTVPLGHAVVSGTTVATTFKLRAGNPSGSVTTLNGTAAARKLGGVMSTFLQVRELMA